MDVWRAFDRVFVRQLFYTSERGETIFYPNGRQARGYLVPPESRGIVQRGVRRLVLVALGGTLMFVVFVPRLIEAWLGHAIPLGWFIGGALVATIVAVVGIIHGLSRLTIGLPPLPPAGRAEGDVRPR